MRWPTARIEARRGGEIDLSFAAQYSNRATELNAPFGSRMSGQVQMQNSAGANLQGNEDVEEAKRRGDRGEKIASNYGFCMVLNERRPPLVASRLSEIGICLSPTLDQHWVNR
jgi:hypothetical protein